MLIQCHNCFVNRSASLNRIAYIMTTTMIIVYYVCTAWRAATACYDASLHCAGNVLWTRVETLHVRFITLYNLHPPHVHWLRNKVDRFVSPYISVFLFANVWGTSPIIIYAICFVIFTLVKLSGTGLCTSFSRLYKIIYIKISYL